MSEPDSSQASPSKVTSHRLRMPSRPSLRQATVILPSTGERVKRTVTLRDPAQWDGPDEPGSAGERSPLLPRRPPLSRNRRRYDKYKSDLKRIYEFTISRAGQSILKCSIAYLLASMATFVMPIAALLGQQDGKHIVATICVYFHPARSAGSMIEAIILAFAAFVYFVFVSFTSMGIVATFDDWNLRAVGHAIVLVLFCGGGLGLVGWIKQRLGHPLVNVACSLASLSIITVLTKEEAVQVGDFSTDKVVQVIEMLLMGIIITAAVCWGVKPVSARKNVREAMINGTDSLGLLLAMITRSFLSGSEEDLREQGYVKAADSYKTAFAKLDKSLKEAKYEHYLLGTERQYDIEMRLFVCLQRLAQNIGGLRSAATTQFALLAQSKAPGKSTPVNISWAADLWSPEATPQSLPMNNEHYGVLASIEERPEENGDNESDQNGYTGATTPESRMTLPTAQAPSDIFSRFIMHLGPSMKSLAYTLKQILDELPFTDGPEFEVKFSGNFRSSLREAIDLYTNAREEALRLLYRAKDLRPTRVPELEADLEEVAASCGYFSYSLQDVAEEVCVYLDILDHFKNEAERDPPQRSWNWLAFWRRWIGRARGDSSDIERENAIDQVYEGDMVEQTLRPAIPQPLERRPSAKRPDERFRHLRTYNDSVWRAFLWLRREDIRFAIKVGLGATLFALPSYLAATRPLYAHWRGEWGLLSYMLVCSMTIGASNTTGWQRFLGTCLGAICAILGWVVSQGNPIALATIGWIMSMGCFYIILSMGNGPFGRFILLTYNLSALYSYSLSVKDFDDDDDEGGVNPHVSEIVLHRVVAVMAGCVWGLIFTRLVWPISARRKFKDGLSLLWLRMALIWKRDPLSTLLDHDVPNRYMDIREETQLQSFLARLEALRTQAVHEFELRGPFAATTFNRILQSTSRALDAMHAMNVVLMKDPEASSGEAEILKYTKEERAQLSARISHLFQVLASSLKLEYPLNDALPNIEHTRDRLLSKVYSFRQAAQEIRDEDYALLYAYALVTGQLAEEIEKIGLEIEKLFGVLDEDMLRLQ